MRTHIHMSVQSRISNDDDGGVLAIPSIEGKVHESVSPSVSTGRRRVHRDAHTLTLYSGVCEKNDRGTRSAPDGSQLPPHDNQIIAQPSHARHRSVHSCLHITTRSSHSNRTHDIVRFTCQHHRITAFARTCWQGRWFEVSLTAAGKTYHSLCTHVFAREMFSCLPHWACPNHITASARKVSQRRCGRFFVAGPIPPPSLARRPTLPSSSLQFKIVRTRPQSSRWRPPALVPRRLRSNLISSALVRTPPGSLWEAIQRPPLEFDILRIRPHSARKPPEALPKGIRLNLKSSAFVRTPPGGLWRCSPEAPARI